MVSARRCRDETIRDRRTVDACGCRLVRSGIDPRPRDWRCRSAVPKYLTTLRRRRPPFGSTVRRSPADRQDVTAPAAAPAGFGIKQAIAKTITFRIIVTTLDFTTNYVVIGELATAAGLSTFNLVAGPVFYFVHETAWNYFGPPGAAVRLPV